MSAPDSQARFGQALVDFSSNAIFPEEETISSAPIEESALPAALSALDAAKADLEVLPDPQESTLSLPCRILISSTERDSRDKSSKRARCRLMDCEREGSTG